MIYFWFSFLVPFTQPFHISHFYMLLLLYAGPSVTDKNVMGLEFDTRKKTGQVFRFKDNVATGVQYLSSEIQLSDVTNYAKFSFWRLKSQKLVCLRVKSFRYCIILLNKAKGKGCWAWHLKNILAAVALGSCGTFMCCNKDSIFSTF